LVQFDMKSFKASCPDGHDFVLGGKSIKSQDHVPRVKANEKDSALWKTWTICIYSIPSLPWKTWTIGFGPLYLLNKCLLRVYDREQ
jgi:hypothetical protein